MPQTARHRQREAQKRILGILNANRNWVLNRGGLAMWREDCNHNLYASANADLVVQDLAELGVGRTTVVERVMPPRANENRVRRGREVRVAWNELATLVHWTQALKDKMASLPEDGPRTFEFVYFRPGPQGMAICLANFAAFWPWWTTKQATWMGLLCAKCRWDLRNHDGDDRLAYRLPDSYGRHHLYCGACSNHGLDHL
ncbi:hypothetical protein [Streptomyces sp. NPDC058572]|uniref:hypothetical protein n=1 Tax=Streptomyces sp. NPDC058572 TaxID=3346546 RepID=UPI00364B2CDA